MKKLLQQLEQNKYLCVKDIFNESQLIYLADNIADVIGRGKWVIDGQCPIANSVTKQKEIESAFPLIQSKLVDIVGLNLVPTFAYTRHYPKNETLKIHTDRPSCEYSVTITVQYIDKKGPWPIFFGDVEDPLEFIIDPGDGVFYKGCEISHWRDPNPNPWQIQIFYHFVDIDGKYKDHAYDRRDYYEFDQQIYDEFMRRASE